MGGRRACWLMLVGLCLSTAAAGAGRADLLNLQVRVLDQRPPFVSPSALLRSPRPSDALPDGQPGFGRNDIAEAWLILPTERYGHGVLGDAVEAGGLRVILRDGTPLDVVLDETEVFEDLRPRVVDVDGDGRDEVMVVRSSGTAGAALALYHVDGGRLVQRAQTPPIGAPSRWLNPVGIGDIDGDGAREIAYVETPHIGGTLRVVALSGGQLIETARLSGVSNHALGSRTLGLGAVTDIDGDGRDEILVPAMGRRTLLIIAMVDGALREVHRLRHERAIVTDFEVEDRDRDGRPEVGYGLADGRWVTLTRSGR